MFKIFRKTKKNTFLDTLVTANPIEALTYYEKLCQRRTDEAGSVLMIEDSLQIGCYRTDLNYPDEAREQTDKRHWIFGLSSSGC